jgi:hypothetical protein
MKSKKAGIQRLVLLAAAAAAVACGDEEHKSGADMPERPTDLKVEPLTGGAHLTWKDNSDNESAFMVERVAGAEEFKSLATVPFDTVQYHDGTVTAGATFKYRVMAMPKDGGHSETTEYSNEATFVAPQAEVEPPPTPAGGAHAGH